MERGVGNPRARAYTFWTASDDGSSVEVNGQVVVDNLGVHERRERTGQVALPEGVHAIRVRYFQAGDHHRLAVLWARDGDVLAPIPANQLLPDTTSYARYQWRWLVPIAAGTASLAFFGGVFGLARRRFFRVASARSLSSVGRLAGALERPAVAVAVLASVAVPLRALFLAGTPAIVWADSHVFFVSMREALHGTWTSHDPYRTLLYPLYLCAVLGRSQTPLLGRLVVAGQQAMGVSAAVCFYLVGRKVFTPLVALGGALLFALHALMLYYEISVLTEALFVAVFAFVLWTAAKTYEEPTVGRAACLGLVCAVLVLVRPVALWFIVACSPSGSSPCGSPTLAACRRRRGVVLRAADAGLDGGQSASERILGVSLGRGMGLYTRVFAIHGPAPDDSRFPEMRDLYYFASLHRWSANAVRNELNFGRKVPSAVADETMYRFARETVLEHPLAFSLNSMRQWVLQLAEPNDSVQTCPSLGGPYLCHAPIEQPLPAFPNSPPARRSVARRWAAQYATYAYVRMKPVLACALLGVVVYFRSARRNAIGLLLAVSIVYFTLVPALSQLPQDRFRLPVDALLFMFGAWGLRAMARRWPAMATDTAS